MPPSTTKLPKLSDDSPTVVSTKNLAIPLWLAVSIISGCVMFTAYMVNLMNAMNNKLDRATTNRWGRNEQRQFAQELERANVGKITVPDVDSVAARFQN